MGTTKSCVAHQLWRITGSFYERVIIKSTILSHGRECSYGDAVQKHAAGDNSTLLVTGYSLERTLHIQQISDKTAGS